MFKVSVLVLALLFPAVIWAGEIEDHLKLIEVKTALAQETYKRGQLMIEAGQALMIKAQEDAQRLQQEKARLEEQRNKKPDEKAGEVSD